MASFHSYQLIPHSAVTFKTLMSIQSERASCPFSVLAWYSFPINSHNTPTVDSHNMLLSEFPPLSSLVAFLSAFAPLRLFDLCPEFKVLQLFRNGPPIFET